MNLSKDQFFSLILDHKKIIYKICHSYCRTPEDKQDLEQEIILQLWKSAERYDVQHKVSTWIYRIALNVAISFLRGEKNRKKRIAPVDQSIIELVEDERSLGGAGDEIEALYHFINQLDQLNRALMLLYLDDYSYEEIAEILGISKTNVGTKVSRIKERLQREFLGENNV